MVTMETCSHLYSNEVGVLCIKILTEGENVMKYKVQIFLSFLKSLPLNISLFGLKKGIKIPFLVNYNTTIKVKKNTIVIPDDFPFLGFRFGIGGSMGIPVLSRNSLIIEPGAKLVLNGKCHISNGSSIRIDDGEVNLGKNFSANKNFLLTASERIFIHDDVTCGWNVSIRDSDGHTMFHNGIELVNKSAVEIGENCWINSWCDILKGVEIDDNCVVAYKSLITSSITQHDTSFTLIGGHPAKVIRKNISWKK